MPAQATASPAVVSALQAKLLDPATSLPHKYRILFSLRSVAGAEAEAAILRGADLLFPLLHHRVVCRMFSTLLACVACTLSSLCVASRLGGCV